MSEKNNEFRNAELGAKFLEMGTALAEEGTKSENNQVKQAGSIMMLLAGLMIDEDDMMMFQLLSSMFTAKKILDTMSDSPLIGMLGGMASMRESESKSSAIGGMKGLLKDIQKAAQRRKNEESGESEGKED